MIEIDPNEVIMKTVRKHWIVLVMNGIFITIVTFIPIILFSILSLTPLADMVQFPGLPAAGVGFFLFAWLLIVWMVGWNMWTDYYLDVLIITNKRIFDIEQYGLFRRRSSAFRLDRIQNISVNVKGIVQTLLDYGTIRLETAGEHEDFVASYVPTPYEVKRFIGGYQDFEMDSPRGVLIANERITRLAEDAVERTAPEKLRNDGDGL